MGTATQCLSLVGVAPLHLGVLEHIPQVLEWIHSWAGVLQLEVLSPEGWYTDGHKQVNFLCPPPPAAADAAVEQLCEAVHKRPQGTHLSRTPFLMNNRWRKQMLKATDLKFFLKAECQVWDYSNHEPLGFFVYLPLCRHEPWRMRYTATVVELESALRILPCDDLLQKGIFCPNFWSKHENWMPCQKAWCASCYKVPEGSRFPIRLPKDEDRNVLVNQEDKTRVLRARVGDHVLCPFQCELCHFKNLQG
jgi:hypothetical protein